MKSQAGGVKLAGSRVLAAMDCVSQVPLYRCSAATTFDAEKQTGFAAFKAARMLGQSELALVENRS